MVPPERGVDGPCGDPEARAAGGILLQEMLRYLAVGVLKCGRLKNISGVLLWTFVPRSAIRYPGQKS